MITCLNCGYESQNSGKEVKQLRRDKEQIVVIGKHEQKLRTLPTTKVECNKCGNREAFYWMVQTRGADESSTQFFRCTKCGQTWREMT